MSRTGRPSKANDEEMVSKVLDFIALGNTPEDAVTLAAAALGRDAITRRTYIRWLNRGAAAMPLQQRADDGEELTPEEKATLRREAQFIEFCHRCETARTQAKQSLVISPMARKVKEGSESAAKWIAAVYFGMSERARTELEIKNAPGETFRTDSTIDAGTRAALIAALKADAEANGEEL